MRPRQSIVLDGVEYRVDESEGVWQVEMRDPTVTRYGQHPNGGWFTILPPFVTFEEARAALEGYRLALVHHMRVEAEEADEEVVER